MSQDGDGDEGEDENDTWEDGGDGRRGGERREERGAAGREVARGRRRGRLLKVLLACRQVVILKWMVFEWLDEVPPCPLLRIASTQGAAYLLPPPSASPLLPPAPPSLALHPRIPLSSPTPLPSPRSTPLSPRRGIPLTAW